jgi:hypothetical protein
LRIRFNRPDITGIVDVSIEVMQMRVEERMHVVDSDEKDKG